MLDTWMKWPWWQRHRTYMGSTTCPSSLQSPHNCCHCPMPNNTNNKDQCWAPNLAHFPWENHLSVCVNLTTLSQGFIMTEIDIQVEYEFALSHAGPWQAPPSQGLWSIWSIVTGSWITSYLQRVQLYRKEGMRKGLWSWTPFNIP